MTRLLIAIAASFLTGTLVGDGWFHLLNKLLFNHIRMKKFEMKAVRLQDLINVVASISPAEVQKEMPAEPVKTITRLEAIFVDLEKANKEYADVFEKFMAPIKETTEEFRKKIDATRVELQGKNATDEEISTAINNLVSEGNTKLKEVEVASEAATGKKALEDKIVTAELSDEKIKLLLELFEKVACAKFTGGEHNGKKPLSECYQALSEAKEV